MKYETVIRLSKEKLDESNSMLKHFNFDGGKYLICSVHFPNKFEIRIQISKKNVPLITVVLFDLTGNKVTDIYNKSDKNQIIGEYYFEDGVNEYIITIQNENLT